MLTFAQFLAESSRSFPLYHGIRNDHYAFQILQKGELQPLTKHTGEKLLLNKGKEYSGISTTRSLDLAKSWAMERQMVGIVLELNQKAIEHNHKIVPINYFSPLLNNARAKDNLGTIYWPAFGNDQIKVKLKHVTNEYEEFIVTNKPIPLNGRYLTAIHVSKARYEQFGDSALKEALDKYKNKVKFY